jgi:hypothetical protein
VSGTKFYYLKNEAVLLEMALISWTLSKLLPKGFVPLSTPDLVRSTVVAKCGFQPRGENTQVHLKLWNALSLWITLVIAVLTDFPRVGFSSKISSSTTLLQLLKVLCTHCKLVLVKFQSTSVNI